MCVFFCTFSVQLRKELVMGWTGKLPTLDSFSPGFGGKLINFAGNLWVKGGGSVRCGGKCMSAGDSRAEIKGFFGI